MVYKQKKEKFSLINIKKNKIFFSLIATSLILAIFQKIIKKNKNKYKNKNKNKNKKKEKFTEYDKDFKWHEKVKNKVLSFYYSAAYLLKPKNKRKNKNKKKLLLLGIDGLNMDYLLNKANAPNIKYFMNNGIYSLNSYMDGPIKANSISSSSWACILSGKSNNWKNNKPVYASNFRWSVPDIFSVLNKKNIETTAMIKAWEGMYNLSKHSQNRKRFNGIKLNIALKETIRMMNSASYKDKFILFYYGDIDYVGHKYGYASQKYINTIEDFDKELGKLKNEIINSGWNLIITTDHSGDDYANLTSKQKAKFKRQKGWVAKGVHGLEIEEHNKRFIIYYGKYFNKIFKNNSSKEILEKTNTCNVFNDIVSYFS